MPPTPKFATIKNAYLLEHIKAAAEKEYSSENYEFYFDKANNQVLYERYISTKADKQVNLPTKLRQPLDDLAAKKQWSAMSAGIKAARVEIATLIDKDTLMRFSRTPTGEAAISIAAMGLDGAKAKQAEGLLAVYTKARSPNDQYQAYLALVKLASKSKVDPVLASLDMPAPSKPVEDAAVVAKNLKIDKEVKKIKAAIPDAMKYYASALKYIEKKGVPADREEVNRMFESARMRHDRIHLPYTELIRQDKAFATKYKELVADKKKLDDAYAAVRTKITKR